MSIIKYFMESKTAVFILMANFNKGKYIGDAIKSVINQSVKDWELIIFDDNSIDNSVEIIESFLTDQRIRLIKNKKNLGTIFAQKSLVLSAVSEIVCILDSDDTLAPNALEVIQKAYVNYSDIGFIYTQCWYCDENLKPVHLGFSKKIPKGKTNLHDNSIVALRTFKKSDYLKTSGYDEQMLFAEDIDLSLKLEEVTKLYFIDKPLYYYRVLPKSQTHSFLNTRINRSSTALAKYNAYKRRLGTNIPNLNRHEISEVLFWGILNSLLSGRWWLLKLFCISLISINPFVFLQPGFYNLIFKKIKKIIILKKNNSLLKI
jgi:glycosyltransferase involved in cell wall biosynthesis